MKRLAIAVGAVVLFLVDASSVFAVFRQLIALAQIAWLTGVVARFTGIATLLTLCFIVIASPFWFISCQESLTFICRQRSSLDGEAASKGLYQMPSKVVKIFWPSEIKSYKRKGLLIGWHDTSDEYFIVAVVPLCCSPTEDLSLFEGYIQLLQNTITSAQVDNARFAPLKILGTSNFEPDELTVSQDLGVNLTLRAVHVERTQKYPVFELEKSNPGYYCLHIIVFDAPRPRMMQHFSISPIRLELADHSYMAVLDGDFEKEMLTRKVEHDLLASKIRDQLLEPEDCDMTYLSQGFDKINYCYETGSSVNSAVSCMLLSHYNSSGHNSLSPTIFVLAFNYIWSTLKVLLRYRDVIWNIEFRLFLFLFLRFFVLVRLIAEIFLRLMEYGLSHSHPISLKDLSATALQLDLRLQQLCYWPVQYLQIRRDKIWRREDYRAVHSEYIRFYNNLWLVANDIIIGATVGTWLLENTDRAANFIDYCFDKFLTTGLRRTIQWLMAWPGGLKLNNELARFFGALFIWVINVWADFFQVWRPYLPPILRIIGYCGFLGATLSISLSSDLLSLLTIHIYAFYVTASRIYHWQLSILVSLFHLFRGHKRNVLRNRIDSCDYDLDQLLVGSLLFTVLIFLLPTVAVFYLAFTFARFSIIIINTLMECLLAALNHFPLFALMLRLKSPKRLPGGVSFTIINHPAMGGGTSNDGVNVEANYIYLSGLPLSLRRIFHPYFVLSERVKIHYMTWKVFQRLLTGQFVPIQRNKLYSLLYSSLPKSRVGIRQLWSISRSIQPFTYYRNNSNKKK